MFKLLSIAVLALTVADASYLKQKMSAQPEQVSGRQFLAQLMQAPTAASIMEQYDHDKDGKISEEDFEKTLMALAKA